MGDDHDADLIGLYIRQLASRVPCSHTHISQVEAGTKQPSAQLSAAIDTALTAGGALAALLTNDGPDRIDHAATTRRIDATLTGHLATVLAGQRHLDDLMGAAAVLPATTVQLDLVQGLIRDAYGPARTQLVSVGAQWAQFAGWLHITSAQWPQARAALAAALEWATETDDHDMIATVLSYQAHISWLTGRIGPVVALVSSASPALASPARMVASSGAPDARDARSTRRAITPPAVWIAAVVLERASVATSRITPGSPVWLVRWARPRARHASRTPCSRWALPPGCGGLRWSRGCRCTRPQPVQRRGWRRVPRVCVGWSSAQCPGRAQLRCHPND
jgi:hypothetical protein